MKLLSRPRLLTAAATLCMAILPLSEAQNAKQNKEQQEQAKAIKNERKNSAPAKKAPLPPRLDPREFPPGVTVLIEGWTAPPAPGDFPEGVTPLAPPGTGRTPGPVIRITLPPAPGAEALTAPAEPKPRPDRGRDLTRAPADQLEEDEDPPPTVGPGLEEQLGVFRGKPLAGGRPLAGGAGWSPVSSLEPRDPEHPYPWNPAEFAEEIIDPLWEPSSDYEPGDPEHPYPWNPATFSPFVIDPYWKPADSWGRSLSVPEVFERYSLMAPHSEDQGENEGEKVQKPPTTKPGRTLSPLHRRDRPRRERKRGGKKTPAAETPNSPDSR